MARREQLKRSCKKQISYEECCYEAIESRKQVKHNPAKLFQVEIVDRDPTKKMVKLHYINYSTNDDVWVDDKKNDICPIVKVTKCYVPSAVSFDDRKFRFRNLCISTGPWIPNVTYLLMEMSMFFKQYWIYATQMAQSLN